MQRESEFEKKQRRRYDRVAKRSDDAEARRERAMLEAERHARRKAEKKRRKLEEQKEKQQQEQKSKVPTPKPVELTGRAAHLATLGTLEDSPVAIRTAYRQLALRYHPDKNSAANAAEMFRRVQAAYEALST